MFASQGYGYRGELDQVVHNPSRMAVRENACFDLGDPGIAVRVAFGHGSIKARSFARDDAPLMLEYHRNFDCVVLSPCECTLLIAS